VRHYYTRQKELGVRGSRPRLRETITKDFAEELALKIDAALEFARLGETADLLIRPILLYYSCAHLCGVYLRHLFEWGKDKRNHGLSCSQERGNVADTAVYIKPSGQFARLATTCFLLTGHPSVFTRLVTYRQRPTAHTGSGELLGSFCANEVGNPVRHLTLSELAAFDYGGQLQMVRQHHGFHKFKGLPTTAFLLDVISLFVASSLARYDVLGWKSIIEGRDNRFRIHFEEVFDRFHSFTIDCILAALEDPFPDFERRLVPSQPSPYSHDDHSRFERDPNCEA
jgi:hypothetical protein